MSSSVILISEEKVQASEEKGIGIPTVPMEDDRIPCVECGKMLPKNAMKRHMMKHEVDNLGNSLCNIYSVCNDFLLSFRISVWK